MLRKKCDFQLGTIACPVQFLVFPFNNLVGRQLAHQMIENEK